ncbi:response regulator [Methylobacterium sp. yr596]|uniref:response regulator n=1 Tax=Methylobacterium sp. yr596 TaxID=1761800 RepID=UPI000B251466
MLLDQMMPQMDGLEACRRLRAIGTDIPAVLITGHPDPRPRGRRTPPRRAARVGGCRRPPGGPARPPPGRAAGR